MDKIEKALKKLSQKQKQKFKRILVQIKNGELNNLDVKKLKARDDIFRVRKGDMRIIFRKVDGSIKILALEQRTSKTYAKKSF